MNKLDAILEFINGEIDMDGPDLEAFVALSRLKDVVLKLQAAGEESAVVTLKLDESVSKIIESLGRGFEANLREFWTLNDQTVDKFKQPRQVPAEFMQLISPAALAETMDSLDRAISAEAAASDAKEASYGGKGDLLRQKTQLETSIKITEAEAMSKVQGEGKSQYVNVAGEKLFLTNDQTRDAYRRMASKSDREELARINGELGRIEVDQFKATDAWYGAKGVADSVGKKADLQAALLNFLAGH
ncbi:MAG: hypothetical protein NHB14_20910 [Desulfosporosinus sp.]|nr:hypothetical protein [Desulfosporosinus sp.]